MELNIGAVQVALLLLPGFLSVQLRDAFSPHRERSEFERFMEALAFSAASVAAALWLTGRASAGPIDLPQLVVSTVTVAAMLGLVVGVASGKDWPYRLARWARLTDRSGRMDVWQDTFSDVPRRWLLVHLRDGRRVRGWARYFSDTGDRPSLFLTAAAWVLVDNQQLPVEGPGVLIADFKAIKYIEFLMNGEGQ